MATLRDRRVAARLSYAELAEAAAVHPDTVKRWEEGHPTRGDAALLTALDQAERELRELLTGARLSQALTKYRVSRAQLAKVAGLSTRTIWEAEQGRPVSGRALRWLGRALKKLQEPYAQRRKKRTIRPREKGFVPAGQLPMFGAAADSSRLALIKQRAQQRLAG